MSASTIKGESEKSPEKGATTDFSGQFFDLKKFHYFLQLSYKREREMFFLAPESNKFEHISLDSCDHSIVTLYWTDGPKDSFYTLEVFLYENFFQKKILRIFDYNQKKRL